MELFFPAFKWPSTGAPGSGVKSSRAKAAGRLLQQVADGFLGNMVVTPREIDEMVLSVADLLSEGLNRALQPSLDEETLHTYLHA